jgi:hypothetical protein
MQRYGMNANPDWVHDDDMSNFSTLKQQLRDYRHYYGAQYNSRRDRTVLQQKTLDK